MTIDGLKDHAGFVDTVASWYFHAWGWQVPGHSVEATRARMIANLASGGPPVYFVAHEAGELRGAAHWKRSELADRPAYEDWLGGVYVAPPHRGRGLGARLCQAVAAWAKAKGITSLYLQTEALDGGLYAGLGWAPVERIASQGREVQVMVKQL